MRRPRVPWMTRADDRILEFLENEGNKPLISTPAVISVNTDYSIDYIRKRMVRLREGGLITYYDEDRGMYEITDRGRAYLAGALALDDIDIDVGD